MEDFQIREALPQDKEAILEFCRNTWEWGDYIPLVLDAWLSDSQSRLLVVTVEDKPVALARVSWLTAKEAWIEGGRVAPEYRGKHIASRSMSQILRIAMEMGAEVVYGNTPIGNTIVIGMMEKMGAERIATFIPYHASAIEDALQPLLVESYSSFAEIWSVIEHSQIYMEARGLYSTATHPIRCYKLSLEGLKRFLNSGKVLTLRKEDKISSFALLSDNSHQKLLVEYIDGQPSSLSEIAYSLRDYCFQKGLSEVVFIPPEIPFLLEALPSAGYHPVKEHAFLVFKLDLRQVLSRLSGLSSRAAN
jgi:RimJ/RimL family protein N-acetyltransferase